MVLHKGETNSGSFKKGQTPWNKGKSGWAVGTKAGFQKGNNAWKNKKTFYDGNHPNSVRTQFKKGHNYGGKLPESTKEKMRISAFEYAKKISDVLCPRIGYNEKKILDRLEQEIKYKIIRQYKVDGYFVDGYIKELNLCIEVDEIPKNKPKDIERQNIIEHKLNCKFLRIKDYD